LTFTGVSPTSVPAGSSASTLTLTGTGFTAATVVTLTGGNPTATSYPTVTYVSSAELRIPLTQAQVASPTTYALYVENFPSGSACAVFGGQPFAVTGALITPTITWSPATTIIFGSSGSNVLNANANAPGSFTYTATPGGTITTTSGLAVGSYTIAANFTPSDPTQYTSATASITLVVSGESVWIVDGAGGTSVLAGNGYGITSSTYSGADKAVAIDKGGNVWTAGTGSTLLEATSQIGTQPLTPTGGGIDLPVGIAIDGSSQVWIANGNNTVSEFSNIGTALSPSSGYTNTSLSTPTGIAIDLSGSVWIANKGNNSVTRILGAAAPAAPLSTAAANKTTGAKP
jgi:hypothetical protein